MESSPQNIWQQVVKVLDEKLDRHNLETWIVPIKAMEITDSALRLGVPSKFFASWLEEHHLDTIKTALRNLTGAALDVEFVILATHEPPAETVSEEEEPEDSAADTPVRRSASGTYLNQKYTFKSFVVGGGNSSPMLPPWRWPSSPPGHITHSLYMAGSAWARPISCRPSALTC